jgi:hypothetical protein
VIGSFIQLFKKKISSAGAAVLLTHTVWFMILGPFHRYNCILFFIAMWWSLPYLKQSTKILGKVSFQYAFVLLIIISSADVVARHIMAYEQGSERNPHPVISWLKEELPSEDCLVSGHAIAYYALHPQSSNGFILANMPPYDYDFSKYSAYYVVKEYRIPELEVVSTYKITADKSHFESKTYKMLYLMRAENKELYLKVLKSMDIRSRAEVAKS